MTRMTALVQSITLFNRKPEACASARDAKAHASGLRLNENDATNRGGAAA